MQSGEIEWYHWRRGGDFAAGCDAALVVPSRDVARIQEAHICAGHLICQIVEAELFGADA